VRLNSLLQQIIADYLLRVEDDRLGFLTVTGVEVDADLNKAEVFVSSLDGPSRAADLNESGGADSDADEVYLEALAEYRIAIQAEIANQARLRKTPEVVFAFDSGVRSGARIESILASIDDDPVPEVDPEVYGLDDDDDEADEDPDAVDPDDWMAEGS
jgi:ribosome-binding factor A